MPAFLCTGCGLQFPPADTPPPRCPICDEARQFVPPGGQGWTTLDALSRTHRNAFQRMEPGLYGIGTTPDFAIGQRALLIRRPEGNILWDCVALLDAATIDIVRSLGGIAHIAISHPHYYTSMVEWSHAFGAPVHLHAADREFVVRPDPAIRFWEGERLDLGAGATLIRGGAHFPGSSVLHWAEGAGGLGVLLTGDTIQVVADRRWVSFMYSFPNLVPLPADAVRAIAAAVEPFAFERLYGFQWRAEIAEDAKGAVRRSAERYVAALAGVFTGRADS
jgi:hypothetical protein